MRSYTEEDRLNMNVVINNTIANIKIGDEGLERVRKRKEIRVSFMDDLEETRIFSLDSLEW